MSGQGAMNQGRLRRTPHVLSMARKGNRSESPPGLGATFSCDSAKGKIRNGLKGTRRYRRGGGMLSVWRGEAPVKRREKPESDEIKRLRARIGEDADHVCVCTCREGRGAILVAADCRSIECVDIHPAKYGTRFAALDLIQTDGWPAFVLLQAGSALKKKECILMSVTVAVMFLIVLIIVVQVLRSMAKDVRVEMQAAARKILDSLRSNFAPIQEFRLLRPEDLPEEGREQLDEAGRVLEKAGGRFIADMENVTISGVVGRCIPIRNYSFTKVGFDAAAYYHPKAAHLIYDLVSDLSDGRLFLTCNAEAAKKLDPTPGIDDLKLPYDTPLDELIRIHKKRLAEARSDNPNIEFAICRTADEIIAREERIARIKYEHRRKIGWVSQAEVERLSPPGKEKRARLVYAEIRKLIEEEGNDRRDIPDDTSIDGEASGIIRHGSRKAGFELAVGSEETIERIERHVTRHAGPIANVFHELLSDLVHLDLLHVEPSAERPFHTFVTCGMSDRPMSPPEQARECRYAELVVLLPPDWRVSQDDFRDESNYWPLRLLKGLARLPHEYETWLWTGHSVPNGDPPKPYAPSTELCCSLLAPPCSLPEEFSTLQIDAEKQVAFLVLVPLYKEEMDFKLREGSSELLDRLFNEGITDVLDPKRKNVCYLH